jgi:glyoxylase-like metal-dependent hydrolase (beta-lactamase superfamily II)
VPRVHHSQIADHDVVTVVSGEALRQNCYLIVSRASDDLAIVDPGSNVREIEAAIRDLGRRPGHLLITHGHPDHIAGAATLSEEFDLDCVVAAADKRTIRHAPDYAAAFGLPRVRVPDRLRFLEDGEDLGLGTERIEVLAVPGHTPGSIAIRIGDLVLTGDTLFRENIGRTDLPGGDQGQLIRSIDSLLSGTPATSAVLPGHGRPWTIGDASDWWSDRGRAGALAYAAATRHQTQAAP